LACLQGTSLSCFFSLASLPSCDSPTLNQALVRVDALLGLLRAGSTACSFCRPQFVRQLVCVLKSTVVYPPLSCQQLPAGSTAAAVRPASLPPVCCAPSRWTAATTAAGATMLMWTAWAHSSAPNAPVSTCLLLCWGTPAMVGHSCGGGTKLCQGLLHCQGTSWLLVCLLG
jgi:hypothetical protein